MYSILPADENPVLRDQAADIPLADIQSPRIQNLIASMKKLLSKEEYGVALAAPQVGESLKLFIVSGTAVSRRKAAEEKRDIGEESDDSDGMQGDDQVYINPVILKTSRGKKGKHEGCLSIRGKWGIVPRAEKVTLKALDENGRPIQRGASGFLAHIFQHEMDHLDGILYIDKAKGVYDDKAENDEDHE
jgi:peptide deformylase